MQNHIRQQQIHQNQILFNIDRHNGIMMMLFMTQVAFSDSESSN